MAEARRWRLSERAAGQTLANACDRLHTVSADLPERPGRDLCALVTANLNRRRAR